MVRRDVSGRYRGSRPGFEVALRVDVDGPRPMRRVSADYYRTAGKQTTYVGSMRLDSPLVTANAQQVTITGAGVFSWPTKHNRVKVTIPSVAASGRPAVATMQHAAGPGRAGTTFVCKFESTKFRRVELEEAHEKGLTPFQYYDTASLPCGDKPRKLTHVEAFADAGIEMVATGPPTVVDIAEAGSDATWSDAELHAAMQAHFRRWGNQPRWAVWLLHAASHDDPQLGGLMFDQRGLQRQGCAVFYGYGSDTTPELRRARLHACVHELGHTFNLPHCWRKVLTDPPLPSRPDARTWMNYPERFPGGADTYWSKFDFGFDDAELTHVRHAFESNVIMGGQPFEAGAARSHRPGWDAEEPGDPGLRLQLSAPLALVQETPVTVGLELSATTRQPRLVPPQLGPRAMTIDIAIRPPGGSDFLFEPLLAHCRRDEMITLRAGDPPVRDVAFIHFGRLGFAFSRPGRYLVRARYAPLDGPVVLSNIAAIDVAAPRSAADRRVAELIAGDEQVGTLMSLMGSDARTLARGNDRLTAIIARYPQHPVAVVARLVQGANLARGFKHLGVDGAVRMREPKVAEAAALVSGVIDVGRAPATGVAATAAAGRLLAAAGLQTQLRLGATIDPAVRGFFNSRLREVNAAVSLRVGTVLRRAAAPPPPTRFRRLPPKDPGGSGRRDGATDVKTSSPPPERWPRGSA